MPLQTIPGFNGYVATMVSSMDQQAIGKLTDSNHMETLHMSEPQDYDKKVISLYTQTSLYANDFQQMLDRSTPFYIDSNSDSFKWNISLPYKLPKILAIPDETEVMDKPGIDGQEFTLVLDTNEFVLNDIITTQKMYLDTPMVVVKDPTVWHGGGYLYTMTILSENPRVDFIPKSFIQPGTDIQFLRNLVGEFDRDLSGLPKMGDMITLYDSIGAGYGVEHTITDWADARILRDGNGKPLDVLVFGRRERNELPTKQSMDIRWEPYVEFLMRKKMMDMRTEHMIWGKPGTSKTRGSRQEIKKSSPGLYHRMRNNGNLVSYNKGDFSINLLRDVFGDLFYRRVDIKNRRVKLYTNEAGMEVFRKANKEDLFNSGLTVIADNRFIQGSGQNMTVSYAFDSVITSETGRIDVVHLRQLDLPQTNLEFGQNKKSTPVFMVFDVSPDSNGGLNNNVREVRLRSRPSMTWGYVDGAIHHLGFARSQGMSSASKDPWYTIWMKDRSDVFVEDLSRTVIIEEVPQF